MIVSECHRIFPDSCEWKIIPEGVYVCGSGLIRPEQLQLNKARVYTARYEDEYAAAAKEYGVPVELLIACSMTESAPKNAETCIREEPGCLMVGDQYGDFGSGFCWTGTAMT